MARQFDLSKPDRTIHAGVILLNSVTEILDIAPFHFMGSVDMNLHNEPESVYSSGMKAQAIDIKHHWVNETGEPARLTAGMTVLPTDTFETCPPLDIVLMGANDMTYGPTAAELAFIRKSHESCSAFIAVCAAYRSLQLAGLLKDKTATAPLSLLDKIRSNHPETNWCAQRWCRDGKIWTTGQLVNGLDAMRAFAESTWGGSGGLVEKLLNEGSWPVRDVDYADQPKF